MIRRASYYLILLICISMVQTGTAQSSIGKSIIRRVLVQQLEKKLPEIINDNGKVDAVNIKRLNIGRSSVSVKGSFTVDLSEKVKLGEDVRFKSRFSLSRTNPAVTRLKVSIPGDKFLFFRRYRRII